MNTINCAFINALPKTSVLKTYELRRGSMECGRYENNMITLQGTVAQPILYSHQVYGEKFYTTTINCKRMSGTYDKLPLTVSETLICDGNMDVNQEVKITGQVRSYNRYIEGKHRLLLTVFARGVHQAADQDVGQNSVQLDGYICKTPVYRTTPFMREICDILLAVNRPYRKSDYIPVIAWGSTARCLSEMPVGAQLIISGRMQSRIYLKRYENGKEEERTAYEVSAIRASTPDGRGGTVDIHNL